MACNPPIQTPDECAMVSRPQSPILWAPLECSTATEVPSFESDFNMSGVGSTSDFSTDTDMLGAECSTATGVLSSKPDFNISRTDSCSNLPIDNDTQMSEDSIPIGVLSSQPDFNTSESDTPSDFPTDTNMHEAEKSTPARQPSSLTEPTIPALAIARPPHPFPAIEHRILLRRSLFASRRAAQEALEMLRTRA